MILRGLSDFFQRLAKRTIKKNSLDRLPNDVILEGVMSHLDIWDILALRQVSKRFYELSYHAWLWKRMLLHTTDIPLPPLPPTSRHTPPRMSGIEAEALLCRAYSLDLNWRRRSPQCFDEWEFDAFYHIVEMAPSPGGHHLVACLTDPEYKRYSIGVYAMSILGPPRLIARLKTETKAYGIRVKYATIKGEKSLVIAFLQREYYHASDKYKANKGFIPQVSELSTYHEIDPDVKLKYQCTAVYASLADLELLSDMAQTSGYAEFVAKARRFPPPFHNLVSIRSGPDHRLVCPDLEEMFDSAYLAVAKWPRSVLLKRLDGGPLITIVCPVADDFVEQPHCIKAIKLLPSENKVFVVQELHGPADGLGHASIPPTYVFATHRVIPAGDAPVLISPQLEVHTCMNDLGHLTQIGIADLNVPPRNDESIVGQILQERTTNQGPQPPLPICVYAYRASDAGLVHIRFPPKRVVLQMPPTPPTPAVAIQGVEPEQMVAYTYPLGRTWTFEFDIFFNHRIRILPAIVRPLICLSPWDDISDTPLVTAIRPVIDRSIVGRADDGYVYQDELDGECRDATVYVGHFQGGPGDLNTHVSTCAWDETIGRLIVAEAKSGLVRVYDFASAPKFDDEDQLLPVPLRSIPDPTLLPSVGEDIASMRS
ncbi:hypothetical protein C8Q70DRAFT_655023 [Cubamyces menziesii]|nr:hypothetical protein C8Q70DRAFT_655023 [Cubamyces menziesii]